MKEDYRSLPIVMAAARTTFEEEEIEENRLLRDILRGRISLEDRLESIPKFSYNLNHLSNGASPYDGASIDELARIWSEGYRETETHVEPSLLSRLYDSFVSALEGILFDTEREVVVREELSVEERRKQALKDLKKARDEEKRTRSELQGTRTSLLEYLGKIEARYEEDSRTQPGLKRFAIRLREEIDGTNELLQHGSLSTSERKTYQDQAYHGQQYFNRLVQQIGHMEDEIGVLGSAKESYTRLLMRLNAMIDIKDTKIRESRVKIMEAELTQDMGTVIEAASSLQSIEDELRLMDEINTDSRNILDAAFDAVDSMIESNGQRYRLEEGAAVYADNLYQRQSSRLDELLGGKHSG